MSLSQGSRERFVRWLRLGLAAAIISTGAGNLALSQQKTMLVEPPAPLLPATIGKLARVAEGDVGDGLGALDPTQAPVVKEDGLKRFAQSDYAPANETTRAQVNVAIYQFIDVSGAMAAYDYFAKPGMHLEKLADAALSSGNELLMRSGKNVVVEHWKTGRDDSAAFNRELIEHLPRAAGNAGMPPL